MTIGEAYKEWISLDKNKTLAIRTRSSFQKVWKDINLGAQCEYFDLQTLRNLVKDAKASEEDSAKACSIIVHVLKYAHEVDSKTNPLPNFSYTDILKGLYFEAAPSEEKTTKETKTRKKKVSSGSLDGFTDNQLYAELKRRGWCGSMSKTIYLGETNE